MRRLRFADDQTYKWTGVGSAAGQSATQSLRQRRKRRTAIAFYTNPIRARTPKRLAQRVRTPLRSEHGCSGTPVLDPILG